MYGRLRQRILDHVRSNGGHAWARRAAHAAEVYLRAFYNERHWDMDRNGEKWVLAQLADWLETTGVTGGGVIDVGAHEGEWADIASTILKADAYHLFEPLPQSIEQLRRRAEHIHSRQPVRIEVHPFGLGSEETDLPIYHAAGDTSTASLTPRGDGYGDVETRVPIRRARDFCEELACGKIICLKLDTEGAEASILEGFGPLLGESPPMLIQFEYGKTTLMAGATLSRIFGILGPKGYSIGRLHPSWVEFFDYDLDRDEHFRFGNYIAVHDASLKRRLESGRGGR